MAIFKQSPPGCEWSLIYPSTQVSTLNITYHTLIDFPHPKFWEHFKTVSLYLKGQKTNKTSNNKLKLKAQTNILEHKRLMIVWEVEDTDDFN